MKKKLFPRLINVDNDPRSRLFQGRIIYFFLGVVAAVGRWVGGVRQLSGAGLFFSPVGCAFFFFFFFFCNNFFNIPKIGSR